MITAHVPLNGREPHRGMEYRPKWRGDINVKVIRGYPWGRGIRVQYAPVIAPEERRETSLTDFLRQYVWIEGTGTPCLSDDLRRLHRIANGPPEWHRKDDPEIGALLKAGHIYIASVLGDFITPAITIEGRNALNQ